MRRKYLGSGLANVLPYPNQTTASFFGHWLSTHNSLGEAMKLLELPQKNEVRRW